MEIAVLVVLQAVGDDLDVTGYWAIGSGFEDSGNYLGMQQQPVPLLAVLRRAAQDGWALCGQLARQDGATVLFLQRQRVLDLLTS